MATLIGLSQRQSIEHSKTFVLNVGQFSSKTRIRFDHHESGTKVKECLCVSSDVRANVEDQWFLGNEWPIELAQTVNMCLPIEAITMKNTSEREPQRYAPCGATGQGGCGVEVCQ
jgi:hypothetical protein